MTLFFKEGVTGFFPEPVVPGTDDHVFRETLVVAWNRLLLRLADRQVTAKEAEEIGLILRRLWIVAQAWKAKNKKETLAEWLERLVGAAKSSGVGIS